MRFLILFLALVLSVLTVKSYAQTTPVDFPIGYVAADSDDATLAAGRFRRSQPDNEQDRTTPYDPNTAPKFEAPPGSDIGGVAPSKPSDPATPAEPKSDEAPKAEETALSPEQKQMIFSVIISVVTSLIAGTGAANPTLSKILDLLKGLTGVKTRARIKALEDAKTKV